MEKKDTLSKLLAVIGTILVWLPIAAPFFFGFMSLFRDGIYRFDFLMPAEFGILALVGGALLLWGAFRIRSQIRTVAWGLGVEIVAMVVLFIIGDVEPGSLEMIFAFALLAAHSLGIILTGIGGIFLWRDVLKEQAG